MTLTLAQLQALKANILADPVFAPLFNVPPPLDPEVAFSIASAYNLSASPSFWVWRTSLSHAEIVSTSSPDGTTWSWPAYILRSQAERDGWRDMFTDRSGSINPSLANVRQGLADIFSGAPGLAQRTHLLAIGRRPATRGEKLFATGTGSTAVPALLVLEGALTYIDVQNARDS